MEGGEDGKEGMRMRSQNKRQRGVERWRVQVVELEAEVHFTLLCSSAAARGSTLALAKPRARTSAGLGQSATLIALQREQRRHPALILHCIRSMMAIMWLYLLHQQ